MCSVSNFFAESTGSDLHLADKCSGLVSPGVSTRNHSLPCSISASSTDLNECRLQTDYFVDLEEMKPLQLVGQAAEFRFESKFEPLQIVWSSLSEAVPAGNRRF